MKILFIGNSYTFYNDMPSMFEDLSHPSYLGSCLAALTHFFTLFGKFPDYTDTLKLPTEVISLFRLAICE